MLINIIAAKLNGIEAIKVTIEVDIVGGIGIHLVGLADIAVKESLLRTITALQNLGFHIPGKKIVINLAPADLHKKGSGYDLPIALSIIAASEQKVFLDLDKYLIMGELGLDGNVRGISGALSIIELASNLKLKACIIPFSSALECREYKKSLKIYGIHTLSEAIDLLCTKEDSLIHSQLNIHNTSIAKEIKPQQSINFDYPDFSNIIGQNYAKRGLEIAAAGGHNVLMIGSPGSGKSSLAKAMKGILTPMSKEESFITSKIYSACSLGNLNNGLIKERPFRSPHHTASMAAILGGGSGENIQAGEVSLAHNGILFIDEYCQAPKSILEALRAPLEDRKIIISRLKVKVEFPASFIFIAATNPCPCGYYGEKGRCTCSPTQRANYLARLSGPIIDRIDIHLWINSVDSKKLISTNSEESSKDIAKRVQIAADIQNSRFKGLCFNKNSEIPQKLIEKYCPLNNSSKLIIEELISKNKLSARAFFRIIRLARTIADLELKENIEDKHIMEAVGYRLLDKI